MALTAELLQQDGAESAEYGDLLRDIAGLLDGSYRSLAGLDPRPVPGQGAQVELGSSGAVPGKVRRLRAGSVCASPPTTT